jgi:hypothetical protein
MEFSNLKPQAAEWTTVTTEKENPAVEWLKESHAAGNAPRQLPGLTTDDAQKVARMLVSAGVTANLGVSIRIVVNNDEFATSKELWETLDKRGIKTVGVKFKAKTRTVRPRKAVAPVINTNAATTAAKTAEKSATNSATTAEKVAEGTTPPRTAGASKPATGK